MTQVILLMLSGKKLTKIKALGSEITEVKDINGLLEHILNKAH
jgi:hypothetical protein